MSFKTFWKNRPTRVWAIAAFAILLLGLTVNVAMANQTIISLLDIATGTSDQKAIGDTSSATYFAKNEKSKEAAKQAGENLTIRLAEEGIVMLKNKADAFPLAKGSRISVFGKNSSAIVYGGSGSGSVDASSAKTLFDSLDSAGFSYNPTLKAFYDDNARSGTGRPNNPSDLDSGATVSLATGETPYASYDETVRNSYLSYADCALIFLSRIGGEGFDLPRTSSESGKHYLELDANEYDLIKNVEGAGFKKIALVINSGNTVELGFAETGELASKIDAIFTMPGPGTTGVMALGEILCGDINPSGHTVDTYAADFTMTPSFANFGDNQLENGDRYNVNGTQKGYYFVDYEENIYVGYRYYETRGKSDGEEWYSQQVVYPFGHGKSYTTFSYELDKSKLPLTLSKAKITLPVKVSNTGSRPGKGVAEIYGHAPYTIGGIEKSEVVLLGFAKSSLLGPGESETLSITVDPYDLASFDYKDANKNGFKGYELDAGTYALSLRSDAHTPIDTHDLVLDQGLRYENDPVSGTAVVNRYTEQDNPLFNSDYQLSTLLSRADWASTWVNAPSDQERSTNAEMIAALDDRTPNNPNTYTQLPVQGDLTRDPELKLYDLFEKNENGSNKMNDLGNPYVSYDNPKWEALLNKLTVDEMKYVLNNAAFNTKPIASIDKPATSETDGPAGFVNFMDSTHMTFYGTAAYCCEALSGATWNVQLLEEMGERVGEEGVWGNDKSDKKPYSGWYAPGVNIHRSPFGGRNFEYFSEDPLLTGKLGAAEVKGARKKGVYCMVKHFALNEQETHRQSGGDVSWVSEQAMREVYLRSFETIVKEGGAYGMMTSFNRIGTRWTGGDYRLLTNILREEWGFRGCIIDDFNTPGYMSVKQMAYAGGDINLSATRFWSKVDETSASDVTILRNAMKNTLYTIANSCAMNGHGTGIVYVYELPLYRKLQIAFDITLGAGILLWGITVIVLYLKKGKAGVPAA